MEERLQLSPSSPTCFLLRLRKSQTVGTGVIIIGANSPASREGPITSLSFGTVGSPNLDCSSQKRMSPRGLQLRSLPHLSSCLFIFRPCTYSTRIFSWEEHLSFFQGDTRIPELYHFSRRTLLISYYFFFIIFSSLSTPSQLPLGSSP